MRPAALLGGAKRVFIDNLQQGFSRTLNAHNSLQGAQYEVQVPVMRPAALLGGAEQPDVELRRFSDCTLPLVWWPKPCVCST